MTTRQTTALLLLVLLGGCASTHELPAEPPPDEPVAILTGQLPPFAPLAVSTPLEACLGEGGRLTLSASVDNDDVSEHGELLTLATSPDGRIAVAAADGTLKLWTMEGFLTELSTGVLLYGAEFGATPASDVLFHDGRVVAGDVGGLVSAWDAEGRFSILGGTDPDVAIVAVAMDRSGERLAHADEREGGNVMVRSLTGVETHGPLATELAAVTDLAFLADGALLLAGSSGLELRGADDPARLEARFDEGPIVEIATARDRVAAVGAERVTLLDGALAPLWSAGAHGPSSVAITAAGRFVITALADGSLSVRDAQDGAEIAVADVVDPVVVRPDPRGGAVIVGSRDGRVSAFECRL